MSYASFTLSCQNYELLMFWLNKNTSHFFNQDCHKLDFSYEIPNSSFITVTPERKQHFFSTFFIFLLLSRRAIVSIIFILSRKLDIFSLYTEDGNLSSAAILIVEITLLSNRKISFILILKKSVNRKFHIL